MRLAILFCICASVAFAGKIRGPVYVKTPVPHWSCPAGHELQREPGTLRVHKPPVCGHVPAQMYGYSDSVQERIFWSWTRKMPESGKLTVHYPDGFVSRPGCEINDATDRKGVVLIVDESGMDLGVTGKPGHEIRFDCRGIIPRGKP